MNKILNSILLFYVALLFGAKVVIAAEIEASVKWDEKHIVQFYVDGVVKHVNVNQGDVFNKGDTLLSLSLHNLKAKVNIEKANVNALKAKFEDAERELKEANTLYEQTVLSDVELQRANINFQIAKSNLDKGLARLEIAKWNLKTATVKAPWAGFVLEKNVLPGQVVTIEKNEAPLLTLVRLDTLKAVAWLKKSKTDTIKLGQKIKVEIDGQKYSGSVKSLTLNMLDTLHKGEYQLTVEFNSNADQPIAAGKKVILVLP